MNLVYPVRPGDQNEELRFSLRSVAAHVPHELVFIAGHVPAWCANVVGLELEQTGSKYQNSTANLRAVLEHELAGDELVLVNDDMYALEPLEGPPAVLHRGPVRALLETRYGGRRRSDYGEGMAATLELLERLGYPDPLSYELHVPLVIDRELMLEVLELMAREPHTGLHKRTIYGALANLAGELARDVKVTFGAPTREHLAGTWLSTDDRSFPRARRHLERMFPARSRYELADERQHP